MLKERDGTRAHYGDYQCVSHSDKPQRGTFDCGNSPPWALAELAEEHLWHWRAFCVHDLRGRSSRGAEVLMPSDPAKTQVKRLAANIYRAAGRTRELLAHLADEIRGNQSTSGICKILGVIIAGLEPALSAAERQDVRLVTEVPGDMEIPLERCRMEHVFFNLTTNALEAMPFGGTIRIGARKVGNSVLIAREDTGPGIPRGIRDRLFEPFVTAGKDHGLGLGLALSAWPCWMMAAICGLNPWQALGL